MKFLKSQVSSIRKQSEKQPSSPRTARTTTCGLFCVPAIQYKRKIREDQTPANTSVYQPAPKVRESPLGGPCTPQRRTTCSLSKGTNFNIQLQESPIPTSVQQPAGSATKVCDLTSMWGTPAPVWGCENLTYDSSTELSSKNYSDDTKLPTKLFCSETSRGAPSMMNLGLSPMQQTSETSLRTQCSNDDVKLPFSSSVSYPINSSAHQTNCSSLQKFCDMSTITLCDCNMDMPSPGNAAPGVAGVLNRFLDYDTTASSEDFTEMTPRDLWDSVSTRSTSDSSSTSSDELSKSSRKKLARQMRKFRKSFYNSGPAEHDICVLGHL